MKKALFLIIVAGLILGPFSQILAQTNHRFTQQELDPASNLYYYGQRYYNANTGRFTQIDPITNSLANPQKLKESTGQDLQKFLENPQKLNEYSYTINNPVKYVDPNGESPVLAIPVLFVALSGIFLTDIKTVQAPIVNSIPSFVESRDFGDMIPGWNNISKAGRFGLGLIFGGLSNKLTSKIASRLATKLDSELANSLVKRAEGGFINLYRGVDAGEFERIIEKGFQSSKYITTNIAEALEYFANKGSDPKLVTIRIPIEKFTQMIEKGGFIKGSFDEEFNVIGDVARKLINQYIVK